MSYVSQNHRRNYSVPVPHSNIGPEGFVDFCKVSHSFEELRLAIRGNRAISERFMGNSDLLGDGVVCKLVERFVA